MSVSIKGAMLAVEDGEDHWLSRPETRTRMLVGTVRFLEQHNPPH